MNPDRRWNTLRSSICSALFGALALFAVGAAAEEPVPRLKPDAPCRGIAVLSSSVGKDVSSEEIEAFVQTCKIGLVVVDFAWITFHWSRSDLKEIEALAQRLQKSGVIVAVMYRPRALQQQEAQVHYAMKEDGSIAADHLELCYAHEDSVSWAVAWGEKILTNCPSIQNIILYNVRDCCYCGKCRNGVGAKHIAAFIRRCRERWRKITPAVLVGHVGAGLEYAEVLDFFCPFLSILRTNVSQPVDTDSLVGELKSLRAKTHGKPFVPLAKICWADGTNNKTEDVTNALRSSEKAGMSILFWYYEWIFHPEKDEYDPQTIVNALGGDWSRLKKYFEKPAAASENPHAWIYFTSRESSDGKGPMLIVTTKSGKKVEVPASGDSLIISYLNDQAFGAHPQLAVSLADTCRVLIAFDPPDSFRKEPLGKAELVLDLRLSEVPPAGPFEIAVHTVEEDWTEESVCWDKQPGFGKEPALVARVEPKPATIRWDLTETVRNWFAKPTSNHGLLLKVRSPISVPDVAPEANKTDELKGRLLGTLPWENDVNEAVRKAAKQNRLILACVRTAVAHDNVDLPEQLLQAIVFADPAVANLVKTRFVPLRVCHFMYAPQQRPSSADPLAPLGTDCEKVKAPALLVATPKGKLLAVVDTIGTFDAELTYGFLQDALRRAGTGSFFGAEGKTADELLDAGALKEAERKFSTMQSPAKEYGLCRIAALKGDHAGAIKLAHALAEKKFDVSGDACVQEAVCLMRQGNISEALARFDEALKRKPLGRTAEALYYLGCLEYIDKKHEKAHERFEQIGKDFPASLWAVKAAARLAWPYRIASCENLKSLGAQFNDLKSTENPVKSADEDVLVERAVSYLLGNQQHDGSWPIDLPLEGNSTGAITALVAHALDEWHGELKSPLGERTGAAVQLAGKWIESYLATTDPEYANSFGTAYILNFLLARHARSKDDSLKKTVQKSVDLLLKGQCPNGAWSYWRAFGASWRGGFGGWPETDKGRTHSVNTGPALLYLARARKQGFNVDEKALEAAVKVLKEMRSAAGVYTYVYPDPICFQTADSSIARGPVCEQALHVRGAVTKADLTKTLETFMRFRKGLRVPVKGGEGWNPPHSFSTYFFHFAYYHAALAASELGGETARKILAELRADILAVPEMDATWVDYHSVGKPYGTAMALLVLRMARKAK